tara:strand:- start:434 stop:1111 length:678 start_codon:yes stop_codon:yes gene_type:complete
LKKVIVLAIFYALFSCSKDDPKPPSSALLVFPLKNSECTTGQNINQTTRLVNFQWQASDNTESYKLRVVNLITNVSQLVNTNKTSVDLSIKKGVPFSWSVTSENTKVTETATSEVWNFYNAGLQTTYTPFPAQINFPKSGATVLRDGNNEIKLSWTGSDLDADIASYDIYFSTVNPPANLLDSTDDLIEEFKVSVESNTIYYWQIVTKDEEGNTSNSGVYSFKVL